jgi:hypothetical protein
MPRKLTVALAAAASRGVRAMVVVPCGRPFAASGALCGGGACGGTGVDDAVGSGVGVSVGSGVAVGVGVRVAVGVCVLVFVGVGVSVGDAPPTTPHPVNAAPRTIEPSVKLATRSRGWVTPPV